MLFVVEGGNCRNKSLVHITTWLEHSTTWRCTLGAILLHASCSEGPANRYFKHALPKLVAIARYTGNNAELMRIVHRIPPRNTPGRPKTTCTTSWECGFMSKSASRFPSLLWADFNQVGLYLKSKYFEGVIFNQQGRLKSAVSPSAMSSAMQRVWVRNERLQMQGPYRPVSPQRGASTTESSARRGGKYYQMIPRVSLLGESFLSTAGPAFMQNDEFSLTSFTTQSLYGEDSLFQRTSESVDFFNLCEYDKCLSVARLESAIVPMFDELKDFTEQYRGREKRELNQAFDAYFGNLKGSRHCLPSLFGVFFGTRPRSICPTLGHHDSGKETIDDQKALWGQPRRPPQKQCIDARRYKTRAGRTMLQEMDRTRSHLADLLSQSEIIRFEVVSAQRADYAYKMSNPDLLNSLRAGLDFATSVDFIYWLFNGEFWKTTWIYLHRAGSCR